MHIIALLDENTVYWHSIAVYYSQYSSSANLQTDNVKRTMLLHRKLQINKQMNCTLKLDFRKPHTDQQNMY
jgi:hypothetical protein